MDKPVDPDLYKSSSMIQINSVKKVALSKKKKLVLCINNKKEYISIEWFNFLLVFKMHFQIYRRKTNLLKKLVIDYIFGLYLRFYLKMFVICSMVY